MPSFKRKRIPEYKGTTSKSEILAAVKRAKKEPITKSKFKFTRNSQLNIFPAKLRQTLVYAEQYVVTLQATAGNISYNAFRLNGLFDPRFAIGGHQPMGFDQLMAIYSRYTVVGARVTFQVTNNTQTFQNGNFGINVRDPATSIPTQVDAVLESQYSKSGTWGYLQNTKRITLNFDGPKYFNTNDICSEDSLAGSDTADPTRVALADCWVACDQATTGPNNTVAVMVKIEYDSYFYEPKNVATS